MSILLFALFVAFHAFLNIFEQHILFKAYWALSHGPACGQLLFFFYILWWGNLTSRLMRAKNTITWVVIATTPAPHMQINIVHKFLESISVGGIRKAVMLTGCLKYDTLRGYISSVCLSICFKMWWNSGGWSCQRMRDCGGDNFSCSTWRPSSMVCFSNYSLSG